MLKIVCFGDSNTFGFDPRLGGDRRYPDSIRWTGRLDMLPRVKVRNLGMNGAGIPYNANYIADIYRAEQPDVVTIMFGSNDVLEKVTYAEQIRREIVPGEIAGNVAEHMGRFLEDVVKRLEGQGDPEVILISPPSMALGTWTDEAIIEEMKRLAPLYRELASYFGVRFLDTAEWPLEFCFDGVHLTEEGHRVFYENIREALQL
ncbi:MAG: hypothetical protein IJT40_01920 [Firmicutes bacterium]|nr:hypothetical protein [Bacillota bacterium]